MRFGTRKPKPLTADESTLLAERFAALSELPLASGLRTSALEVPSDQLRATMMQLADRFEQGSGAESVLREQWQRCPENLRGVIAAALNSGQVGEVLGQYVEQQRTRQQLMATIRGTLAYPILLLSLCLCLVVVFSVFVLRDLETLAGMLSWGFPSSIDNARIHFTQWWSRAGVWYLLGGVFGFALAMIVVRIAAGPARWQRLKFHVPFLGPLYQWIGTLEWSRMMSLLLNHRIPLTQAIQWASQGSSDASIRHHGTRLAADVEQGRSLSSVLEAAPSTPDTLALLVQWGERVEQLPAAFATAADYFEDRARLRLALLRLIVPPTTFTLVAALVFFLFGAVMATFWSSCVEMFAMPF